MSSTEWLVENMARVPLLVIPCYEPYLPRIEGDESFHQATLYGSIFPPVWNFQLALHTRGYGTCITTLHLHREDEIRQLLGIPQTYVQGCLLPVGRLRAGHTFSTGCAGDRSRRWSRATVGTALALEWAFTAVGSAFFAGSLIASNKDLVRQGGRMRMPASAQSARLAHS